MRLFLLPSFIHTDTDYVIATRPPSGNIDGGLFDRISRPQPQTLPNADFSDSSEFVEIRGYDGL